MFKKIKTLKSLDLIELIKGSGIALVVKIIGTLLLYGFTLYLTNKWGADIYGEFALFLTSMKVLSVLLIFGTDTSVMRIAARSSGNLRSSKLVKSIIKSYITIIGISSISLIVLYAFKDFISNKLNADAFFVFIIIMTALFFSIIKLQAQLFRGLKSIIVYSVLEFIVVVLISLVLVVFCNNYYEINSFYDLSGIYLAATIICAVLACIIWQQRAKYHLGLLFETLKTISFKNWFSFLKGSSSFLLATSITMFSFWLTQLVLKIYHGSAEVGIYDVISRVCMVTTIPLFAVSAIVAPQMSESFGHKSLNRLKNILQNSTSMVIVIGIPMCIVLIMFSDPILELFGSEFVAGGNALQVLIIGYVFNILSGPCSLVLQMTKHENIFRNIIFISSSVCIILCVLLIPRYEVLGAAIAYNGFVCTGSILNVYFVYRKFGFIPFPGLKASRKVEGL